MKEIANDIKTIIRVNRKNIGPIRKEEMSEEQTASALTAFSDSIGALETKAKALMKTKRGNSRDLAEECISVLEDVADYLKDISTQYEAGKDRTVLADNLEETLDMLEDILYIEEEP